MFQTDSNRAAQLSWKIAFDLDQRTREQIDSLGLHVAASDPMSCLLNVLRDQVRSAESIALTIHAEMQKRLADAA